MSSNTTDTTDLENQHVGSQDTFSVRQTTQGKCFIQIPEIHLVTAGFEEGDDVMITPVNYNGGFALLFSEPSGDDAELTRSLRPPRSTDPECLLTLPKQIASAGRLVGDSIRYNSSDGKIIALLDHDPEVSGVKVFNVTEEVMSRWKSGVYAYQIPDQTCDVVEPGDTVWFWFDVMGNDFLFVLETDEEAAPDGAVSVSVRETPNSKTNHRVHLPKQIGDAFALGGQLMKWGHDGERVTGLVLSDGL